jgi:hypothetical protein
MLFCKVVASHFLSFDPHQRLAAGTQYIHTLNSMAAESPNHNFMSATYNLCILLARYPHATHYPNRPIEKPLVF